MLFHTWTFLVFLLVVLPVFFALRKTSLWLPWLTVASYFFYGWWNPYYLFLVLYSTVLDFFLLMAMLGPKTARPAMVALTFILLLMALGALYSSRRIWLAISLVNNLALLLFFKYARFVVENLNSLFDWL